MLAKGWEPDDSESIHLPSLAFDDGSRTPFPLARIAIKQLREAVGSTRSSEDDA